MKDNYSTRIETVIFEVDGHTIEGMSFASTDQAETYKRGVRIWATQRRLRARVYSQVVVVAHKDQESVPASPSPSLAM